MIASSIYKHLPNPTSRTLKRARLSFFTFTATFLVGFAVFASAVSAGYFGTRYVSKRINVAKSSSSKSPSSASKSEFSKPRIVTAAQDPVPPPVTTDKTGYLVGETVNISGSGFAAGENVTVQVRHANNSAEAGGSHDPFAATAQADGTFSATWNLTRNDSAGNDYVVSAIGNTSGYGGTANFKRIANVRTDKFDYKQGETVSIYGTGFAANETVTIQISHVNGRPDGNGYSPFTTTSNGNGEISANWVVDPTALDSILLLTATGGSSGLKTQTLFTDVVVTAIDDAGADDLPGQKDLNQMSTDNGGLPTSIGVTWNWDDTAWSGGNTGDACSLFDTDGDGKVNFSLCVTVGGIPAAYQSTTLYTCGDTKSDRCSNPTPVTTFTSSCTATIPANSDPFRNTPSHTTGNTCSNTPGCYTDDTVAACTIQLSDVGASNAKLLNVCSYPSQEPNSDPSDCVITPNNGFLTIKKTTQTNDNTSTNFVFNTNQASQGGVSQFSQSISGQQTDVVVANMVSFGPTNNLSITEVVPSEWDLTAASCQVQLNVPQSTGTFNGTTAITGVSIQSGLETICTFTDTAFNRSRGKIKVVKVTDPVSDSQSFQFNPSWESSFSLTGGQDHTSGFLVPGSSYSVSETVPTGWDQTSASCDNGTTGAITVVAQQTTTCTFTNTKRGHLIVQKTTDPASDPTSFTINASGSGTITGGGAGSVTDATDKDYEVTPGTYSVAETVPTGWNKTGDTCQNVSVAAGETKYCLLTNTKSGHLIVQKTTDPASDPTSFTINASGSGTITGGGAGSVTDATDQDYEVTPGTYSVAETVPAGWDKTGDTCQNVSVAAGQTKYCLLTNTKRGHLIVQKTTAPAADPTSFTINATGNGTITGGGAGSVTDATDKDYEVTPGTYSVAETVPTGWDKTGDTCQNVSVAAGQTKYCLLTNTKRGLAKVVKTFNGGALGANSFTFQLRTGASAIAAGTIIETGTANSGNGGIINFSTQLVAGSTYQLCEQMQPGWLTTLGPPLYSVFNPSGDNSVVCTDFTVNPGETKTFTINNQPPPGGMGLTIGFWKNWASCANSNGGQKPTLDRTVNLQTLDYGDLVLTDTNSNPDVASICTQLVSLLNKSTINGKKMSSDPIFNMVAQLVAADLNVLAGAGQSTTVVQLRACAHALLDTIHFNGNNYNKPLTTTQTNLANCIAVQLDRYNNNLSVSPCANCP